MRRDRRLASLLIGLGVLPIRTRAEAWPSRPLKLIVATTPGGPSDILARGLAAFAGQRLGAAVVVENRPGANSILGADAVAKSPPDGYTFLVTTGTAITINQHVFKKLPYDPETDLVPVGKLGASHFVMYARKDLPFDDARGFIAYAKANPEALTIGINGVATPPHFAVKRLEFAAGTRFTIVQYKGAVPAFNALMGGQLDLVLEAPLIGLPFVQSGRVKAVAATGLKRFAALPQVQTLAEIYPGFEAFSWFGVMAPRGVTPDIIGRFNRELQAFIADAAARERLAQLNLVLESGPPEAMAEFIRTESRQWAELIRRTGITVES